METERWGNKMEYLLTLMGYSVGVGSIWKFPYMVARNGGGCFMLVFAFFVIIGAIPITYMEMSLGQFSQGGTISAWEICPAFKGLGMGSAMLSSLFSIYYPVFFSWILYYLIYSFYPQLPWTQCGQPWNTPDCVEFVQDGNITDVNSTAFGYNVTDSNITAGGFLNYDNSSGRRGSPAAEEFFRRNVLEITDGLESMGSIRWPLFGCLAFTFLTVYICIIKGIRLSGKIVYVTVTAPYILVTIILVRACMLPGARDGILFYIMPDIHRLADIKVWLEACGLALYSIGVTYGFLITTAAHNPLSNNCFRDSVLVNILSLLSNIYFGFSVFAVTGHLAYKRGVDFDHYKTSGFKLGFITYPEATSYLPVPQLWSVLLFLMLFLLGIDTLIPCFEVVTHVVGYWIPRLTKRRWLLNAVVLIPSFLLCVPYTSQGGVYLLTLVEWFAFFPSLVVFAITECIVVYWIYGVPRLNKTVFTMHTFKIKKPMEILLKYVCPSLLLFIFGYSLYSYRPPQFEQYVYPPWANLIGWCISMMVVFPLPAYFVWSVWKAEGNTFREKLADACKARDKWDLQEESAIVGERTELADHKEPFM